MPDDIRTAIIAAIVRAGWTQAELSRRTGIAPIRLSEYLRGIRQMSAANLEKLMAVLHLTVN